MLRREARLRREYVYRKSVESQQRVVNDKRDLVKRAIDDNRPVPTELRKEALELQRGLKWSTEEGAETSTVDDEYRWAGASDPKIMITTSRDPSARLKMFAKVCISVFLFYSFQLKEMKLVFPNAQRMNRGHYDVKKLVQACKANDVSPVSILFSSSNYLL
jgi:U3 small nucleolar ribonucleoprotein protein IMP4